MKGVTCTRCRGTGGTPWTTRPLHTLIGDPLERIEISIADERTICGACDGTGEETWGRPLRADHIERRPPDHRPEAPVAS